MKKIIAIIIGIFTVLSTSAYAYGINDTFFIQHNQIAQDGIKYLDNLVGGFANKYVVEKTEETEFPEIERFYEELSKPLTQEELDKGKSDFDFGKIINKELKDKIKLFKSFGGLSGYKASFMPIVSYNIYRNIMIVGGFTVYEKTHQDPYEAYWQCVCEIENLTKEKVMYFTRMKLVQKVKELNDIIDNDSTFKIFILVDGKINSVWEKL